MVKKFSEFLEEDFNALVADPDDQTSETAKKLGVKNVGFGKYADQKGRVTHRAVNGKITPTDKAGFTNSSAAANSSLTSLTKTFGKQTKEIHNLLIQTYSPDNYENSELEAIKTYTDRAYVDINKELNSIDSLNNDQILGYIENIDSALLKGQTPAPFNVFFILDGEGLKQQLQTGMVIQTNGYRSATINPDIAIQHSQQASIPIIMQVAIPAMSAGMYIEDYSVSPEEYEFLLPRGTTIRIDSEPKKIMADEGDIVFHSCTLVKDESK